MKIFIASSKETKNEMTQLASWLESDGVTPLRWDDPKLFVAGSHVFSTLIELTKHVDAAIFVFGEDDRVWYHKDTSDQPRDNVLIEYGLFAGALGSSRAIICKSGNPKNASDIQGITFVDLNSPHTARGNIKAWLDSLRHDQKTYDENARRNSENYEFRSNLHSRIEACKSLQLLGYNLEKLTGALRTPMVKSIQSGAVVRVIVINPFNAVGQLMKDQARDPQAFLPEWRRGMRHLLDIRDGLGENSGHEHRFEVRIANWIPSCNLVSIDSELDSGIMNVGLNPPSFHQTLEHRVSWVVRKSVQPKEFSYFSSSFETLWRDDSASWDWNLPEIK